MLLDIKNMQFRLMFKYNLSALELNTNTCFSKIKAPIPISGPHSGCETALL